MMAGQRRLRPATIIPPSLYVEREADRQLREVILDMGRPGYILVARQMGKTNLLLNAKRQLEEPGDLYVYLDLSNRFSTLREFYRNIIDTATSIHPTPQLVENKLSSIRSEEAAPHREYELSLRALLSMVSGKSVIILDEIDSLSSSNFSDQVFSQIRSMYFSRINYPDFERLTYILSGVAEPSDLIKDKNVSPFNIGQKIYLDDFSNENLLDFLKKANLNFSHEVSNRIFYWTDGNPRMTWDICAELEALLSENYAPESNDVDEVVQKLYLNHFNKAPIDHIRTLVQNDTQIRDAVRSLKQKTVSTLDDTMRGRLYLAGITKSEVAGSELRIKNPIIEAALSDRWIEAVRKKRSSLLGTVMGYVVDKRYQEAIPLLEEYISGNLGNIEKERIARYQLGICYYNLNRYEEAQAQLLEVAKDQDEPSRAVHARFLIGLCLLRLNQYANAAEELQLVINSPSNSEYLMPALANLAATYLKVDPIKNKNDIIRLYEQVINQPAGVTPTLERARLALIVPANYNLAIAYEEFGDIEKAIIHLNFSYEIAQSYHMPAILLRLLEVSSPEHMSDLLGKLSASILHFSDTHGQNEDEDDDLMLISRSDETIRAALLQLWYGNHESFSRVFEHARISLIRPLLSHVRLYLELWSDTYGRKSSNPRSNELLVECLKLYQSDKLAALDAATYLLAQTENAEYSELYADLFLEFPDARTLNHFDFMSCVKAIEQLVKNRMSIKASKLLDAFNQRRQAYKGSLVDFVLIDFYRMTFYATSGDYKSAQAIARQILADTDKADKNSPSFFPNKIVQTIRDAAQKRIPGALSILDPLRHFGRNSKLKVRYNDGTIVSRKFKQVELDLRSGQCSLVED